MDTKIRLPLRALGRHAFPKWNQLASSTWHEVKLTWRGRHFKNAPQNKMKIPTVPPTHVPTPPWIKTHQDHNTMSKNKAALRSSRSSWGLWAHVYSLGNTYNPKERTEWAAISTHSHSPRMLREPRSKSFPIWSDFVGICTSWKSWCFATEFK